MKMKRNRCLRVLTICGIWGLFSFAGLLTGCSGSDDDYPKGEKPSTIESVRKVACIGNSITYGARQFLNDREKECYPALLGNLLGEGFEVGNFGRSGTTLLKNGNSPYWDTPEYTQAKEFLPNIVIVKFGTNDSRSINWPYHGSEFESDLTDFVFQLRSLSTRPKVFLCTPAIAYSNSIGADDGVITGEIIPAIRRVAEAQDLTVIDLHTALQGHQDWFPDGIHPGLEGNKFIAETIYSVLAEEYSLNK